MRRTRRLGLVVVLAVVLVATGCEWAHVRGDAALTGRANTTTTIVAGTVNRLVGEWQSAGVVGSVTESPTITGARVFTQRGAYLSAPTGCPTRTACEPAWTWSSWTGPGASSAPVTESGDRAFVLPAANTAIAGPTFSAYAIDGTTGCAGSPVVCYPIWRGAATGVVPAGYSVGGTAAPTVAGGIAYVITSTGQLLAYDAAGATGCTGSPVVCEPLWSADGIDSTAPVAVVDGTVFATAAGAGGGLLAFAADGTGEGCTGEPVSCEPLWRGAFAAGAESLPADRISPAAIVDGVAYVTAGSTLHAFVTDGATGCAGDPVVCPPSWTAGLGSTTATTRSAPAVDSGRAYVLRDGSVAVVDAADGSPIGSLTTGAGVGSDASGPVLSAGVAWVGTDDGLLAFDAACAATCAPLFHAFAGRAVTTPAIKGDRVHVFADGTLQTLVLPPVPPVELLQIGGTRNHLGTGTLLNGVAGSTSATARANAWLSLNGYCTRKAQGDRVSAKNLGGGTNDCAATNLNPEYDDTNATLAVDLPAGRTEAVDVVVFHGNFTGRNGTDARTLELTPGGAPQSAVGLPTTFTLLQPDATPDDLTDNPAMGGVTGCAPGLGTDTGGSRTFASKAVNAPDDNYDVNIAEVTNAPGYWLLCRIPPSAPAGRYPIRVRNQASAAGAPAPNVGMNNYGVLAIPNAGDATAAPSAQRLCDPRSDRTCPRVVANRTVGLSTIGVSGAAETGIARIPPNAAGAVVELQLWDVGEGAQTLRILRPESTSSWVSATFDWTVVDQLGGPVVAQGTGATSVDLTSLSLDDRLLTIRFRVPTNYNPVPFHDEWRVRVDHGSGTLTDRTTWSASVVG